MKNLLTIIPLFLATTCTQAGEDSYCGRFNLGKDSQEYSNCKAYYSKMEGWFALDHNACSEKASAAIPEYLYDHARFGETQSIDRYGNIRSSNIIIEPDYRRNQSLDSERDKIMGPCMQQKGWKSSTTWQAGRIGNNTASPF
jgi:hypothetical protein